MSPAHTKYTQTTCCISCSKKLNASRCVQNLILFPFGRRELIPNQTKPRSAYHASGNATQHVSSEQEMVRIPGVRLFIMHTDHPLWIVLNICFRMFRYFEWASVGIRWPPRFYIWDQHKVFCIIAPYCVH